MPYAVELYLNVAAELAVRQVWEELVRTGVVERGETEAPRAHITLAVYEDIRHGDFLERLEAWAAGTRPFVIHLPAAGAFLKDPVTVFLAPGMTDDLYRLHRQLHELFRDIAYRPWAYYLPDAWTPHLTVAEGLTPCRAGRALERVLELLPHISGTVESVSLRSFDPAQTLGAFDLMGR